MGMKLRAGKTWRRDWLVVASPTILLAREVSITTLSPSSRTQASTSSLAGKPESEVGITFYIDDKWVVLIQVCSNPYILPNI